MDTEEKRKELLAALNEFSSLATQAHSALEELILRDGVYDKNGNLLPTDRMKYFALAFLNWQTAAENMRQRIEAGR